MEMTNPSKESSNKNSSQNRVINFKFFLLIKNQKIYKL